MDIEFDPAKNKINIQKHGVNFAEVEGVFYDSMAITVEDTDHGEQRFVTLGADAIGRLLVVCYVWRSEAVARIISARKAEPHERKTYEE